MRRGGSRTLLDALVLLLVVVAVSAKGTADAGSTAHGGGEALHALDSAIKEVEQARSRGAVAASAPEMRPAWHRGAMAASTHPFQTWMHRLTPCTVLAPCPASRLPARFGWRPCAVFPCVQDFHVCCGGVQLDDGPWP